MTAPLPTSETTPAEKPAIDTAAVIELLASRICHDLVSPVGAINNGVEFLEDTGADGGEDFKEGLNLIAHSASQASAKLMAFRIAYGAGGRDGNIKPEDVQKAFSELIRADGKISQTWDPYGNLGPKPLPYGYCKVLMGAMMLAQECLIKGGYISIRPDGNNTVVIAEGDTVLLRDNVEAALSLDIAAKDLDPRLVHPYALSVIAQSYGFSLSIKNRADDRVTFLITCPAPVTETPEVASAE